jgi:hypothetical protein
MEETKKKTIKKVGRPVKYVYLDKYERQQSQTDRRIDAVVELMTIRFDQQKKRNYIVVAILCATIILCSALI